MTALPTHTPSPLQAAIAADAVSLAQGELSHPAVYRRGGQGAGVAVRIVVSSSKEETRTMGGRGVQPSPQHTQQRITLFAAAAPNGTDAGGGVTSLGQIIHLDRGDTFVVAGSVVNRSAAQVTLKVASPATVRHDASWYAEVRP